MDKIIYLWLQKIADKSSTFNVRYYLKNFSKEIIEKIFSNEYDFNKLVLDNSIISYFLDEKIKSEVYALYEEILVNEYEIVSIEDEKYPRKLMLCYDIPFYFLTKSKVNLNNKNVYIYYSNYYSKFAKDLIVYFSKVINSTHANVITEYENDYLKKLDFISEDEIGKVTYLKEKFILPNKRYIDIFRYNICDIIIIIEARYEKNIVKLTDYFIDRGKEIYVVPSDIYRKNSYFSNYLIKQGADIILNKSDLKFILKNIIC